MQPNKSALTLRGKALYKQERQMYRPVINWLRATLKDAHPGYSQKVFNTSRTKLQALIEREGLHHLFPLFPTYEIMVDVTAILKRGRLAYLGFVECKLNPISLKDIGQLWGYAKVAQPIFALIVSPSGVSEAVRQLLQVHQRYEILDYAPARKIRVAIWDSRRGEVLSKSVIPPGGPLV